ncbi:hypothetical protein [Ruminococcus sp. 5_1_39BFAA]|uniref:hypothetical protein n=1 Tax=Ruminococcus sp. 5_1_39BFAA TaxID=457412 RepID=UPI003563F434
MPKNDMFRVALFGGYNKEDVMEYIRSLENDIESIKVLHQKEKNDLIRSMEQNAETAQVDEGELQRLKSELEQKEEELRQKDSELVQKAEEVRQKDSELEQKAEELRQKDSELEQKDEELRQRDSELENIQKELGEKEEELGNVQKNLDQSSEKLKDIQEKKTKEPEKEQPVRADRDELELEAISKVLEDARKNAAMIEEDARKKAEKILEKAQEDIKNYEKEVAERMNAELESKGIQLFAAKHKITHYMKEVKRIEESLYHVYTDMNCMVDTMPVRLDDYWAGEHYKLLAKGEIKEEELENLEKDAPERKDGEE